MIIDWSKKNKIYVFSLMLVLDQMSEKDIIYVEHQEVNDKS